LAGIGEKYEKSKPTPNSHSREGGNPEYLLYRFPNGVGNDKGDKVKNPNQRVAIFVDVQNLYYSARALYDKKVNFGEIIKMGTADRQLIRAIAYTIKADLPDEQSFFDALGKLGFDVKSKDLQTFAGGHKKGDWDVGITVDILKMAPKLDAIVLCSGDGDYKELLHHAKAEGCRAEVISFGKSTSSKLIEEADELTDLDLLIDKVLIDNNRPPRKRK